MLCPLFHLSEKPKKKMRWSQIDEPGGGLVTKRDQISGPYVTVTHLGVLEPASCDMAQAKVVRRSCIILNL